MSTTNDQGASRELSRTTGQPPLWRGWMRCLTRGLVGRQNGSMLVETAFILPVFLLLVIGFCEYALALASYMNATYAARVGARYAAMHSLSSAAPASVSDVQSVVKSQLFLPGLSSNYTVIVLYGNRSFSTASPGNYQGDLVGIGVLWTQNANVPFFKNASWSISTQAYRVITR